MANKSFFLINFIFFIIAIGILIFLNPNLNLVEDFAGHFYKAQQQPLSGYLQGWNLNFWGGYSEDIYPNSYHYLLRLLLSIFAGSLAPQILTLIIISTQIIAFAAIAKTWFSDKPAQQKLYFTTMLFLFITLDSHFLGGITGTIYTGGGPAALGFLWFLISISLLSKPIQKLHQAISFGLLLGLAFLTHTISAVVIALVCLTHWLQNSKSRLRLFEAIILGSLIGLPTIWIALNPNFHGSRINFPGQLISSLIPLVLTVIAIIQPRSRHHPLLLPTIILMLLSFLPVPVSDWLLTHGFSGIHFYRFYPYALTLLILVLFTLINPHRLRPAVFWVPTLGSLILAVYFALTYTNQASVIVNQPALSTIHGRLLDTSTHAAPFGIPHALQYTLTNGTTRLGSENLFFESSPYGILYYSLKNILVPESNYKGIDIRLLRKLANLPRYQLDPLKAADLLGVNYLILTSPQQLATPSADTTLVGTLKNHDDGLDLEAYVYVRKITDTPSIVSLKTLPSNNAQPFASWWPQASLDHLFFMEDWQDAYQFDLSKPQITNIIINRNSFSYRVGTSNTWVPVLAKFTYSPYFVATSNGETVPIARVSPDFMLIPSRGRVEVTWQFPPILKLFETTSLISLGISITIAAITFGNSRYKH